MNFFLFKMKTETHQIERILHLYLTLDRGGQVEQYRACEENSVQCGSRFGIKSLPLRDSRKLTPKSASFFQTSGLEFFSDIVW